MGFVIWTSFIGLLLLYILTRLAMTSLLLLAMDMSLGVENFEVDRVDDPTSIYPSPDLLKLGFWELSSLSSLAPDCSPI